MGHKNIVTALKQMEIADAAGIFQDFLRDSVRHALIGIMAEEVTLLCGPKHYPVETAFQRAGSELGIFYDRGEKQSIVRPRVKNKLGEVKLQTYAHARNIENITQELISAMENGISTRGFSKFKRGKTVSRSEVSRHWIAKGLEKIEELRSRDLKQDRYFGLTLDGVHLSDSLMAIIAVGYLENGDKKILDFNLGSSENYECAKELMVRIVSRGFNPSCRLLCVLDGSEALKKAVKEHFPEACIQRCLVHKEKNLKSYLRKSDHGECARLMSRLRKAEGDLAGREALRDLELFLEKKNKSAHFSLLEAGDELIALHKLNVPCTLNTSLLSTNIIENTIRNLRRHIGRNNRWRPETTQADRWLASGLLFAEKGFRKIKGYKDIPVLMRSLGHLDVVMNVSSDNKEEEFRDIKPLD